MHSATWRSSTTLIRPRSTAVVTLLVVAMIALGAPLARPAHAATADKIAPAIAPAGTGITITGTELTGTSGVTFMGAEGSEDDVDATSFIVVDPKKLIVQLPAGARSGPVAVTSAAGTVLSLVPVVIAQTPVISSLSAPSLAPGATLRISGDNLLGIKKTIVGFETKKAVILATSTSTALDVVVPAGLRGGPMTIVLTTDGGVAYEDFSIAPALKLALPASGTTAGGTVLTVTGTGFTGVDKFTDDPDTDGVDESLDGVTVGGERVADLIAVSDTEIVVVTPPGAAGSAPIVVRTLGDGVVASSTTTLNFAYQPIPAITAMTKDWNELSPPGTPSPITATGVNLTDATKVYVGALPATDISADTEAGTLTFTPPPLAKAFVGKLLFVNTHNSLPYSASTTFSYVGAPAVAKVYPLTGPAGTTVTLYGKGFVSGTTATFGGVAAGCTVLNPTMLRCIAPAGSDTVSVIVNNGVADSPDLLVTKYTYVDGVPAAPAPGLQAAVSGFMPNYGTPGSTIALKGVNLNLVNKVEFTGAEQAWVEAPHYLVVSASRIVVTVPGGVGTGVLRVTTPTGRVYSGYQSFTASVRPSIASIDVIGDAKYGVAMGDMLEIKGAGLMVGSYRPMVLVGGKPAGILTRPVPTAKTIIVRIPASVGGREQVTLTTPLGTTTAEASVYFTPQPKLVKPLSYVRTGGIPFSIMGTGFTGADQLEEAAGGRLAGVTFGGIPVAELVVVSDKELWGVTASGSATVDAMLVRTQHGSWIGSSDEQVRATNLPVPAVTSVTPNIAILGLDVPEVTITGRNLRADSTVEFGTWEGEVVSAAADGTSLVVTPPERSVAATVGVTVTNVVLGEELSTTLAGGFRYLPQPAIDSISPAAGFTGVTPPQVTITGANLRLNSVVKFGDTVAAVDSVSNDGTELVVTPPLRNEPAIVDVVVVNLFDDEELTATLTAGYDYQLRAYPTVESLEPDSAVAGAATPEVTITGTNLRAQSVVKFGNVAGTVQSAAEDGTSLVVVPPVGTAGTVAVTVTNTTAGDDLSVTVPGAFRYLPTPTVTGASPNSGTVGVAQPTVTITGTNLLANSVVKFGGTAAANGSVNGAGTSLTVTPPVRETPGPVDITVTNIVDGEELTATLSSGYTYLDGQSPTISGISPATGITGASNPNVTMTGTKLKMTTAVNFGGAPATVISAAADGTSMVVTPPVSTSDGYVAVSATNISNGQQLTSAMANGYRYLPTPSITNISPGTGLTGATPPSVTITGTNLRLNSVVKFGTASAIVESVAPDGTSLVVTPPLSNTVGAVNVTVTNIVDGTQQLSATSTNGYQYNLAAATISGKSAQTALPGTQITLTGTSFWGVTAVKFGTTNATFAVANTTTIYATVPVTPSGAQGTTADITIVNGTGDPSTGDPGTADDWTWAAHPLITAMTPTSGGEASTVVVTGSGFTGATSVRFGGIDVVHTVVDDTTIHATVPVTPSAGSVADVTVVARGLTSPEPLNAAVNDWTWAAIAVITQLNPNPAAAGSTITVTGRNFSNVRKVTINNVDVTASVVVSSSTSLTFTLPARPGGGGANRVDKPVYVTNGSGALSTAETDPATGKPANLFTWL